MSFGVSFKLSLGFHLWLMVSLGLIMLSSGFIYGFFRVHLGLHVGFLIRISLGLLWFHLGSL